MRHNRPIVGGWNNQGSEILTRARNSHAWDERRKIVLRFSAAILAGAIVALVWAVK